MKQISVNTNKPYNICFCENVFQEIKKNFQEKKIHIITDENVYSIYKSKIPKENIYVITSGEDSKSFNTYEKLCLELIENNVQRDDLIIAFGGGVVGDLAGFVAATLLRGISYIQVPTTLLSMADSSVGGKTGINTKFGKNLVGAFYQPAGVFINKAYLLTLSDRIFSEGMGEIIKYALIYDKDLYEKLYKNIYNKKSIDENIILRCCEIKSKIVSEDEKEKGIRKILNFGHTLGHIVEKNSDFYHGEAVAVGMYEFAKLSEKLGFADNISEKIKQLLSFYNLPFEFNADIEILEKYMKKDKKSQGEYIDCILLREIGKAFINKIKIKEILDLI